MTRVEGIDALYLPSERYPMPALRTFHSPRILSPRHRRARPQTILSARLLRATSERVLDLSMVSRCLLGAARHRGRLFHGDGPGLLVSSAYEGLVVASNR
jgi:hypothetical protein